MEENILFQTDPCAINNIEMETDNKKEFINLSNIKETGYYFDEEGILRYIKDNSPFPFKSLLIPLFKVRYDIFRTLTAKHVREVLNQMGLISQTLYTDLMPAGIRVLLSRDLLSHTGPLLVIVQAGGVTRAGVWSSRLLMHSSGGINVASHSRQVRMALERGYGVVIINPAERLQQAQQAQLSPEEVIHSVWTSLIPHCAASHVLVWAHLYGGTALLHPLQPPPDVRACRRRRNHNQPNHIPPSTKFSFSQLHCATARLPIIDPEVPMGGNNPTLFQESYDHYLSKYYQKQQLGSGAAATVSQSASSSIAPPVIDLTTSPAKASMRFMEPSLGMDQYLMVQDHLPGDSLRHKIGTSPRKRSSIISSNNATDNSSLHSDISASLFGSTSPRLKPSYLACAGPPSAGSGLTTGGPDTKSDDEVQRSEMHSTLDKLQQNINKNWGRRRDQFWDSMKSRVAGIVFTDSAVCLKMQGIMDPGVHAWFKQNAVHYVACVEELGVSLNKSSWFNEEVPTKSAGTAEHDTIPHVITDNAFAFFRSQLSARNAANTEQTQSVPNTN